MLTFLCNGLGPTIDPVEMQRKCMHDGKLRFSEFCAQSASHFCGGGGTLCKRVVLTPCAVKQRLIGCISTFEL